jgi:PAS domain S-box-containing protein
MNRDPYPDNSRADAFAIMANASPVVIWVTDDAGNILFINQACYAFFRQTEAQLNGRVWEQWLHPDDAATYVRLFDAALQQRAHFKSTGRLRRHDGAWRWVESTAAPYWSSDGVFLGMVGSSPDITELIEHEQALQASEDRFRHMADNAPVLVWVTEPDGSCSFLSKSWYEYTGQTPDTGLGFGWMDAAHPEDQAYVRESFLNANAKHAHFKIDYRLRSKDGGYIWVIDTAAPRFDASEKFIGYVGSVLDITDRKISEDLLKEAHKKKDEFLATLAHELRNPLAPIRTGLEIMRLRCDDPQTVSQTRQLIERQVVQLVRLIDDLMDVARIATGKLNLTMSRVDVSHLIDLALETTGPVIAGRGHTVTVTRAGLPAFIQADAVRITQVFANVLTNAAKYTPPGGSIGVELQVDGHDAVVRIVDSGIGVPVERQEEVFEMFSQVCGPHHDLADEAGGLGIGLHLVKRLVELHGGRVTLTSAGANRGTTVEIRLPLASTERAHESARSAEATHAAKRKVLVIDDNADAAESLAVLLGLQGHEAQTALDGEAGLAIAAKLRPDMILLDLRMPRMSGYQVARAIRTTDWGRQLVLVALSGYGQEDDFLATQAAGFDYHLVKPVDPKLLQAFLTADRRATDRA